MIYEFSKDLQTLLAERKYPVHVRFGPERVKPGHYPTGHVIVVEHDSDAGDKLLAPPAAKGHPRMIRARVLGAKATIYARSSLPGAHQGDHERECEKIVDALTCAMYKWGAEARVGDLPVSKMGFIPAPEGGPEVWPGAVYEIRFGVPRGVYDREYVGEQNSGAAGPTGVATGVANTTVAAAPGVPPATGCDTP